jgi:glycosyltransferase involved in cell wall biosynthesis
VKILFIQESDWLERNPIIQHHLLEIMSLRGHEVRVIDFELLWSHHKYELFSRRKVFEKATRINRDAKITLIRPGILKIPILDYVSVLFSHNKEIKKQLLEWYPDVIVGDAILNSYLGARAAKKACIPFIYYWFELMHLLIPVKPLCFVGEFVEKRTLISTDKVLATSEKLKMAISKIGYPINNIQVLEVGVALERYDLTDHGYLIREQYNIKKDDYVLFFMGWLYKFSGLKEGCLEIYKLNNPKIKLMIVGEGDAYQELREIQNKYNLQQNVIITGQKPFSEIPQYLATADVCLLPSYNNKTMRDIIPGKVYEYMAAGKPVISTKLPGMLSKFGIGNGVVFVEKPEDCISKSIELIENGQCKDLGFKARKYIEKYSWDKIADEFEDILQESIIAKNL